jgi:hypothetical protein
MTGRRVGETTEDKTIRQDQLIEAAKRNESPLFLLGRPGHRPRGLASAGNRFPCGDPLTTFLGRRCFRLLDRDWSSL